MSKWRENVMNKAVRLEEMESNMKNKVRGRGGGGGRRVEKYVNCSHLQLSEVEKEMKKWHEELTNTV